MLKKSAGLQIDDPSNKDEFLTKAPGVKIRRPFTQKCSDGLTWHGELLPVAMITPEIFRDCTCSGQTKFGGRHR